MQIDNSLSAAWATAKAIGVIGEIDAELALRFAEMEQLNALAQDGNTNLSQIILGWSAFDQQNARQVTVVLVNALDNLIKLEKQLYDVYSRLY